jgi:chorismate mutase
MSTDDELHGLRLAIDAADRALLDALGQRLAAVHAIGEWKRAHGVGAVDPAREAALRGQWAERAAAAGVPGELADAVLRAVLDGCRAEVARLVGG